MAQIVKRLPAMRRTGIRSLGGKDPLEKEMAIHSSILVWKIPWTEEPGRLQSTNIKLILKTQQYSPFFLNPLSMDDYIAFFSITYLNRSVKNKLVNTSLCISLIISSGYMCAKLIKRSKGGTFVSLKQTVKVSSTEPIPGTLLHTGYQNTTPGHEITMSCPALDRTVPLNSC